MACNCNTQSSIQQIRDGQDFQLIIKGVSLNGTPVSLLEYDFTLTVWSTDKKVIVERKNLAFTSKGAVQANCTINSEKQAIVVYIKASKVPMGVGVIRTNIILSIPDENFEDGVQVVKSLDSISNIQIIA